MKPYFYEVKIASPSNARAWGYPNNKMPPLKLGGGGEAMLK